MSPRTITFIALLSAGAIGSWHLTRSNSQIYDDELPHKPTHQGYYLKQARILGNADNGSLLYEIYAEHAEQLEDDQIEFTEVRIRYLPGSEVPWIIDADFAILQKNAPRIVLHGYVQIVNPNYPSEEETEIRTQYIELDPKNFIAETDQQVQIRFGSRSVTATGMLASLNDDKIELKSNIRGKIAP
ncbi:MAG: LPS export ABC transporter periplasmic protein LptC [Woeseiaceae bacterium]|jgi:lipopolysaccharide export system protein LptC|nr:LPS export ABC transporter periplasmic protein LptC [Woeseiaceae bacterium]